MKVEEYGDREVVLDDVTVDRQTGAIIRIAGMCAGCGCDVDGELSLCVDCTANIHNQEVAWT